MYTHIYTYNVVIYSEVALNRKAETNQARVNAGV